MAPIIATNIMCRRFTLLSQYLENGMNNLTSVFHQGHVPSKCISKCSRSQFHNFTLPKKFRNFNIFSHQRFEPIVGTSKQLHSFNLIHRSPLDLHNCVRNLTGLQLQKRLGRLRSITLFWTQTRNKTGHVASIKGKHTAVNALGVKRPARKKIFKIKEVRYYVLIQLM